MTRPQSLILFGLAILLSLFAIYRVYAWGEYHLCVSRYSHSEARPFTSIEQLRKTCRELRNPFNSF